MLKAVCVEAGMNALRRGGTFLVHEDYVEGIAQVQSKKKSTLNYYAWYHMHKFIQSTLNIKI